MLLAQALLLSALRSPHSVLGLPLVVDCLVVRPAPAPQPSVDSVEIVRAIYLADCLVHLISQHLGEHSLLAEACLEVDPVLARRQTRLPALSVRL